MSVKIECVVDCKNILGEVPVWDGQGQALYWVDIEGKLLQRYTPSTGVVDRWTMPERIACFALREKGGLIVAFASGIAFYDLKTGAIDWIARPDTNPRNRFNEGKCDRLGRFWAGTMDDRLSEHSASLFRVDPDRSVHKVFGDIGISNCFIWSLDNRTFYFADTLDKRVYRYDYDHRTGAVSNRRPFVEFTGSGGPDGGTIDAEGFLWITHFDGWRVIRVAPDGRIDREIRLPTSRPTSAMFGGPNLETLYITTAIWDSTPEQLKTQKNAGGLFALDVGVRGVPEPRFAG